MPIARIIRNHDVYYIQPLLQSKTTVKPSFIYAPGVARVPVPQNAQRWHERLGHTGQTILKKTSQFSKGLEGVECDSLGVCETFHLSNAQRFVSREPRPTPNSPLDEIFVDTVRKISVAINGHQYAVIITDAKTRMRWVITTQTKDQIAPLLVKWIEAQHNYYGKRIHAIFRDGAEFSRIKSHCELQGIRTDISAPNKPEQNGVSEFSNKVICQKQHVDSGVKALGLTG